VSRFARCEMLFGDDFDKVHSLKVLIVGVGGVGSYCLDALWRTGVSDITIVDFDTFDESNQNRQIGSEAVGEYKTEVLAKKYGVQGINVKITPEWVDAFDFEPYDFVVDAIDDVKAKCALLMKCHKKVISSMGSAKRIDPTKMEVTKLSKTHNDPLARKVRDELKKAKFSKDINVVFSSETPLVVAKGSYVGVTGAFGLACASYVIQKTLSKS